MAEQADGIFLGNTKQGEAEGERDAMHLGEDHGNRGNTGKCTRGNRQGRQAEHGNAAISEQQQDDEADRADAAQPFRFAARAGIDQHGEIARPADHQPGICGRRLVRGKGRFDRRNRFALRGRIETGGMRLHQQQGLALGRKPDAIAQQRLLWRRPLLGEFHDLERGVAWQDRLEQGCRRRAEILHALTEFIGQGCCIQRRGVEARGQQIAIWQQGFIKQAGVEFTVDHLAEMRVLTQRRAEPPAQFGQLLLAITTECQQQQA